MKKCLSTILAATVIAMALSSCDRISDAVDALKGKPDETPDIVKKQREIERIRQNGEWTDENQRKYPKEYCQAMLEELEKKEEKLQGVQHKVLKNESALGREIASLEEDMQKYGTFLEKAKTAYREAEASGTWPTVFNGHQVSQKEFQKRIVEAGKKCKRAETQLPKVKKNLAQVSLKKGDITKEQERVEDLRDRLHSTIRDIELQEVTGENIDLGKSLNGITDALIALGKSTAVGTDDTFWSLTPEEEIKSEFKEIMGE